MAEPRPGMGWARSRRGPVHDYGYRTRPKRGEKERSGGEGKRKSGKGEKARAAAWTQSGGGVVGTGTLLLEVEPTLLAVLILLQFL